MGGMEWDYLTIMADFRHALWNWYDILVFLVGLFLTYKIMQYLSVPIIRGDEKAINTEIRTLMNKYVSKEGMYDKQLHNAVEKDLENRLQTTVRFHRKWYDLDTKTNGNSRPILLWCLAALVFYLLYLIHGEIFYLIRLNFDPTSGFWPSLLDMDLKELEQRSK